MHSDTSPQRLAEIKAEQIGELRDIELTSHERLKPFSLKWLQSQWRVFPCGCSFRFPRRHVLGGCGRRYLYRAWRDVRVVCVFDSA